MTKKKRSLIVYAETCWKDDLGWVIFSQGKKVINLAFTKKKDELYTKRCRLTIEET